jgi:hypothetical protein
VIGRDLVTGKTTSCGCWRRRGNHRTHERTHTREHKAWLAARARCYGRSNSGFANYGGRGITMCDRWRDDFAMFLADMGQCPPDHSLDRIDCDGPYAPENCRWATRAQQNRNKRNNIRLTLNGRTMCLIEWAEALNISRVELVRRLRDLPLEDALANQHPAPS